MKIPPCQHRSFTALAVVALLAATASATTLFNSNFDSLAVGTFADNAAITSSLVARTATNSIVSIVDLGGGNHALAFTDNSTTFVGNGYPLAKITFAGLVSSNATGENQLRGSFDVTRLQSGVAFNYLIQSGLQEGAVSPNQVVHIQVSGSGVLTYMNGSTSVNAGVTLALGTAYRITFAADLSSTTQDKWSLTVATVAAPSVLLVNATALNTRNPNLTPDIAVFRFGGDAAGANASPAYRIDNVSLDAAPSGNVTLWRIGKNDNSFAEFSTGSPAATYAVPADWSTRTDWTGWKQVTYGTHNPVEVNFSLASVPANGVEFSFRAMYGNIAVPQLSVHANGNPAGLIQVWGERGTTAQTEIQFRKIYRLYIPKEFLVAGANTLRLEIAPQPYEQTNASPGTGFNWDYLQLDALAAPATEPIHGNLVHLGTHLLQKDVGTNDFVIDNNTVAHAETLLKWLGIAYSGNALRAGFWSGVTSVQPARLPLLQKFRDLNMRVVANHLDLGGAQTRLVNGELAQQDKTLVDNFLSTYGNLIQFFEVANEPYGIGGISKQTVIAHTIYLNQVAPLHIQIVAPGWAYSGWEATPSERRSVEDLCDVLGGHAYGASFCNSVGGSFIENTKAHGPILTDGFPKPFIATEMGTNNWHADFSGAPTQTNASIFDRIVRGHVAVATYALQHASHFKIDDNYEDFSLFAPINWATATPDQQAAAPGIGTQETRLQSYRRLALAYSTHGKPLTYVYLSQPTNQRVYFRAVDTSTLAPLAGSGATSNKVLLNFVNFEDVSRTLNVRVTMPSSGTWSGDRIGPGLVFSAARTAASLAATPTIDFTVTLPARKSVQYILAKQ